MTQQIYTTLEVKQLTGASLRQLQWRVEAGIVKITLNGHGRVWDKQAVRLACILTEFRSRGVPLHKARKLIRELQTESKVREILNALDLLKKVGLW